MASATVAEQEYLQTLFWLQEAGLPMTGANVVRAMQLSAPTVHEMVGRLERDGYITRDADRTIAFTATGAEYAEEIVRRHRLIERFLTDVLAVPWDEVHEEAERLEHAMSPVLEERMLAAIGDAKTCPHGHPIVAGARLAGVPLADVEVGASVRVLRFENEAEDLLHYLKGSGLEPGLEGAWQSATRSRLSCRRPTAAAAPSRQASPRPSRWWPILPRRRAPRCPSSWCSASATVADPPRRAGSLRRASGRRRRGASRPPRSAPGSRPSRPGAGCSRLPPAAKSVPFTNATPRSAAARCRAWTSVPAGSVTHMK